MGKCCRETTLTRGYLTLLIELLVGRNSFRKHTSGFLHSAIGRGEVVCVCVSVRERERERE